MTSNKLENLSGQQYANRLADDENERYFRASTRLFSMNGQWWFASREGDQGPFDSTEVTEIELERHVTACQILGATFTFKERSVLAEEQRKLRLIRPVIEDKGATWRLLTESA